MGIECYDFQETNILLTFVTNNIKQIKICNKYQVLIGFQQQNREIRYCMEIKM